MHTLGKPPLLSLARQLEAHHGVRIGLVGRDVYIYGAGHNKAKLDAIREYGGELKAELMCNAAIARAQASARQQIVRRAQCQ